MVKRSIVALSLIGLLVGTGVALAQDSPGTVVPKHAHGMARLQKRLALTDDQVTAIKAAYEKHREAQKQAWEALRLAQADLRQLALSGGDTTAKTAEVQQLLGQTVVVSVRVLQEIGPILTPEQRAKFADLRPSHDMRHQRRAPKQS